MTIVKQMRLFDIHELMEMESSRRFDAILATFDLQPILQLFRKTTMYGAPRELNYGAMVQSLVIRIVERIPTVKDLVKRLKYDILFRLDCGFLLSDCIPSEASYSRMVSVISGSDAFVQMNDKVIQIAFTEGFLTDEHITEDATHFEARDAAKPTEKTEKTPKKRGRKSKEEREAWLLEQAEIEANQSTYEKKIETQLAVPTATLLQEKPIEPQWGVKKNSDGKNTFWFGYKAHLAVSTKSQYIVAGMMSSGNLSDSKAAIPLLKKVAEVLPNQFTTAILDKGYDYEPIYRQILNQGMNPVIPYVKRRESELLGFDQHFRPTCVREHSYCYDSFDKKYQSLKFTRPKECATCPLRDDSLCQKVFKIKCETDIRKYTYPARGSDLWKQLYKERSAVERVNAYLKEYFQLDNVRHRSGKKAKLHFQMVMFIYNACKLATDRLNAQLNEQQHTAA